MVNYHYLFYILSQAFYNCQHSVDQKQTKFYCNVGTVGIPKNKYGILGGITFGHFGSHHGGYT